MAKLSNILTGQSNLVTDQDLAAVATTGSYSDLTNKPTIPTGSYTDLTNKPTLAAVATSGSYVDLSNKPVVISLKGTSVTYPGDDLAVDPAGAQTITITGTGFESTPTVYIGGTIAPSVTFVSSTQISVTTPAKAAGTYDIYIVNPGGATAIMIYGISYSGVPAWSTSAGSLGSPLTQTSFSTTLSVSGDAPVNYNITSGSLPSGLTLNTSTGVISGTTPTLTSTTVYNFTIRATDAQNQDTDRSFSLTIIGQTIPGAPTIGTATVAGPTSATITFTAPVSDGNSTITSYTATSTPGSITGTISQAGSGTITVSGLSPNTSYTFTVTATNALGTSTASAASNQITTPVLNPTIDFLVVAGGGSGGMQGNRSGGGGGAGGLKTSYTAGGGPSGAQLSPITVALGTQYTVTVGAGGASTPAGAPQHGFQGTGSVFGTITTTGGGGGGAISNYAAARGAENKNGGSGGGANGYENTVGTGVSNEGFNGGTGVSAETTGGLSGYAQGSAGGGGGASAVGYNASGSASNLLGGGGGPGRESTITGTSVTYAGGGGGAATNFQGAKSAGIGGPGGGGAGGISGSTSTMNGTAGTPNTGGGGGGASQHPDSGSGWPGRSGTGGSGVVILRYPSSATIGLSAGLTGSTATDGSFKVTTITAGTGNVYWS